MADIIQVRRDTAANWTSADPTLANGEIGYETDTEKIKFGDGSTAWTSLGYFTPTAAAVDEVRLSVYNNSGSLIAAGQAVYVSGYNVGTGEPTIALADANDSNAIPAAGFTDASIANLASGSIVTFGIVNNIVTTGQGVGDPVYVDTTPGGIVFTRPSVDALQKLGTVLQVSANGKVLVAGAGRTNDVPIVPSFTDYSSANHDHSDSSNGGAVAAAAVPDGADATAIHDDTAGEIAAVTEKVTPVSADLLLIEDSAAANAKKRVQVGNLPGGGGGEANTGSNQGTDGVGVFDTKSVVDLQFRNVAPGSAKITTTLNVKDIDIDIAEAQLTHDHDGATGGGTIDHVDLASKGTNTHAQIDTHLGAANPHSGSAASADLTAHTGASTGVHGATGSVVGTSDTQTLTNKDLTATTNKIRTSKGITIPEPTTADDFKLDYVERAVTITKVVITVVGSATPSCTVDIHHGTSRNAAGNALITSPTASTEAGNSAESTGHVITSFNDATVPALSHIWVEIDAVSGTVDAVEVTVFYDED